MQYDERLGLTCRLSQQQYSIALMSHRWLTPAEQTALEAKRRQAAAKGNIEARTTAATVDHARDGKPGCHPMCQGLGNCARC